MPQVTPKLGMTTYDLVNDGSVYFSTFRTTLAGYTNSALTKIDDFATQISADVNLLKSNPPIVRVSAIKTDDFSYAVTGITEITTYNNGMYINLSLDNTNIGTVSLNINNLGAKGVYKIGADGLVANMSAGDLRKNKMQLFRYNGTAWVWVNAITSDQLNIVGTAGNLTKISSNNTLEDSGVTFATTVTNNAIAQRTATGQVKVANPIANEDASTKSYTDAVNNKIGILSALQTTAKTDVVSAINEVEDRNFMYGDPVATFENFDPINAQFLEGNSASYFSTKAYADTKAPINSPTFIGVPSSVTPAVNDNTTKIATTAFVNAEISNDRPYATTTTSLTNGGTGIAGTSSSVARADHTHTMPQSVLQSQVVNDLTTGGETSVLSAQQGVELSSAIGQNTEKIEQVQNMISKVSFQAHEPYRAWQGVSTDGEFIYVTSDRNESFGLQNIISVYDMKGNFIKEKLNAYTATDPQGKFMSFGDCTIIDGKLFATVYNVNSGESPLISRVVEFSLTDLSIITTHEIGGGVAECVVKRDNEYWVSYHDVQQVKKFNLSFSLLATYPLSQPASSQGGYQGMFWLNNNLYLNVHGANFHGMEDVARLDSYLFNGTTFTFVESIKPPTFGSSQGVCLHNGLVFWNDRASNEIIITNFIKTNSLQPLLTPITQNYIFKPTLINNWTGYDLIYDRPLKVWKDPFGVVHLEGIITGGVSGDACCILPEGYRPQYSRNFAVDAGGMFGRIAIVGNSNEPKGSVICVIDPTAVYVCLDGITFLADPTM